MGLNTPKCPECGSPMVLRTAQRGPHEGEQFYGCSRYPDCTTILNLDEVDIDHTSDERGNSAGGPNEFRDLNYRRKKRALHFPVRVEAQPPDSFQQSKLFQSIAATEDIVQIIEEKRPEIKTEHLFAFSQWRLDYPMPHQSLNPRLGHVIGIAEKVFTRGSITFSSSRLEKKLDKIFDTSFDRKHYELLRSIKMVSRLPRKPFRCRSFDSEEEKKLYKDVFVKRSIEQWVIPQVSASSLTQGTIDAASEQRVDFVFCHPEGGNYVIEIDGLQHKKQTQSDKKRDNLIENNGYRVLRIPASEVRTNGGQNYRELLQAIEEIADKEIDNISHLPHRVSAFTKKLLYGKLGSQVQLSLLEAIKGGSLSFQKDAHWKLAIVPPKWIENFKTLKSILDAALDDFNEIITDLYKLYLGEEANIRISLTKIEDCDLVVNFNARKNFRGSPSKPVFTISDIYFPFKIGQALPNAKFIKCEDPDKDIVKRFLYYIFRKEEYFEGQWEAIKRTLQGRDSILLLPTGGGKTIAFQLAALLLPGVCLVIDPLIALIRDQVANLRLYGIDRVAGISSRYSRSEKDKILDAFGDSQYLFFYASPERLQMEDFRAKLRALTVSTPIGVITIDEAHCVSEWGHDFRVSYLNIAENARKFCKNDGVVPPLLGLTGTASRSVLRDIRRELRIDDFDAVITPDTFDRPELKFKIVHCSSEEKHDRLSGILNYLPQQFNQSSTVFYQPRGEQSNTGIIFFPHINGEYGIYRGYKKLKDHLGGKVGLYGGKAPKEIPWDQWDGIKEYYADRFRENDVTVLTATKAFGMGIDKPNIRYTIHTNLPASIEAYYQEAGRAGRDRDRSECVLIISNDYPKRNRKLLDPNTPLSEIAKIIDEIPWGENDDISRQMYFHVRSFRGIQDEYREVERLLDELGEIDKERKVSTPFPGDDRTVKEKAVHRLSILGVIRDYTVNYANNTFDIFLSGNNSEENLDAFREYVANYDQNLANQAVEVASEKLSLPHREFILYLARKLIKDFIYNIIELSRRRSLSEMLQATREGSDPKVFRARMLNYLEMGQFSELLEEARQNPHKVDETFLKLVDELGSPKEAAELRGQTSRLLEGYPNNPALLLIRSLSEAFCRDRDEEVIFDNFLAFLSFGRSSEGWDIGLHAMNSIVSQYINIIGRDKAELGQELVVAYLDEIEADRETQRSLLNNLDIELSGYITNLMIIKLSSKVEIIIT